MSRRDQIIEVARELLERAGADGVTMQAIADQLEIRSPSLYKHVGNRHEILVALIAQGLREQADVFTTAITGATNPVLALAQAYRAWATENPHLYALMNANPLPREDLPNGVEEAAAAPLVDALAGDTDRARAVWAFAHGMVSLELAERFPPGADLDAAWATALERLTS